MDDLGFTQADCDMLAEEYERNIGEGPYPTYADLARRGEGKFTHCSLRAIARARLAAPTFTPPEGLPEGPWEHHNHYVTSHGQRIALGFGVTYVQSCEIARAIASIPAMLAEKAKLHASIAELLKQNDALRGVHPRNIGIEITEAFADNQRLRASNAELREALERTNKFLLAMWTYQRGDIEPNRVALLNDNRAILTKAEGSRHEGTDHQTGPATPNARS